MSVLCFDRCKHVFKMKTLGFTFVAQFRNMHLQMNTFFCFINFFSISTSLNTLTVILSTLTIYKTKTLVAIQSIHLFNNTFNIWHIYAYIFYSSVDLVKKKVTIISRKTNYALCSNALLGISYRTESFFKSVLAVNPLRTKAHLIPRTGHQGFVALVYISYERF